MTIEESFQNLIAHVRCRRGFLSEQLLQALDAARRHDRPRLRRGAEGEQRAEREAACAKAVGHGTRVNGLHEARDLVRSIFTGVRKAPQSLPQVLLAPRRPVGEQRDLPRWKHWIEACQMTPRDRVRMLAQRMTSARRADQAAHGIRQRQAVVTLLGVEGRLCAHPPSELDEAALIPHASKVLDTRS